MGNLFKRTDGKCWFAQFKDAEGEWTKRSTGCTGKRAADEVLARFEREVHEQRGRASPDGAGGVSHPSGVPAHAAHHSINEALTWLLETTRSNGRSAGTFVMYEQKAGHLVRKLGHDGDVNALTLDVVQRYVNDRTHDGAKLSTVSKELVTLRAALNLARSRRLFRGTVGDVIPKLNAPYVPRERYLADESELHALCSQLPAHRALWVLVAVYTGGRASEVAKLEWPDVKWIAPASVMIRGSKTKDAKRVIPLADKLVRELFPHRQSSGPVVGAWPNCRRDLAAACKRAGIARVSPNDLRRSFASWLKQAGADSAHVARLLGHSSTKMVDLVYGRLDLRTLASTMALLPGGTRTGQNPADTTDTTDNLSTSSDRAFPSLAAKTVVPQPGIEPGTRGFSIRAYVDPSARHVKRYIEARSAAGQERDKSVRVTQPHRR
jgi:integrase